MVFSSISFLYYFLPILLIIYFWAKEKYRNLVLLLASLFFYFCGEPVYIIILVFSICFNYYFGKYLEKAKNKKVLLIINLIVNFGILFYFKYANFLLDNINGIFNTNFYLGNIIMPIGISFFTFQATSYIIDIYNGKVKSAKNILTFATYLSLFPQLIAGPIVRYKTVEDDLKLRKINYDYFVSGLKRFVIGLAKKVILANTLGKFSYALASLEEMTVLSFILRAIANTLQLYLDFSGYSDMAIGLGLMFGFKFQENFNYPLIATSITDFWRRWHISLSSWFKDYVYIPLGGSRVKKYRRYFNILVVWMLTGLWHGASWNFIFWGLYFALILIIEKAFLLKHLKAHPNLGRLYTIIFVIISFVIFNENNLASAVVFLKSMFGLNRLAFTNLTTNYYLKNYLGILIFSILASTPLFKILKEKVFKNVPIFFKAVIYFGIFIVVTAYIIDETFNPFLYFRF